MSGRKAKEARRQGLTRKQQAPNRLLLSLERARSRSDPTAISREEGEDIAAELDRVLLGPDRLLRILPARSYDGIPPLHLRLWCHLRGYYFLPTRECIHWLRDEVIRGRRAIEVCAGQGVLGRALGLPCSDWRVHERLDVRYMFALMHQPIIRLPSDVECLEALEAVHTYRPQVVLCAWGVQRIKEGDPIHAQGSAYGVEDARILQRVETYCLLATESSHGRKLFRQQAPHLTLSPPWVRSRAQNPQDNRVWIWHNPHPTLDDDSPELPRPRPRLQSEHEHERDDRPGQREGGVPTLPRRLL